MMVMKLKFQKSSLAQGSFKAQGDYKFAHKILSFARICRKMVKPQVLNKDNVVPIHNERLLSHKE